jgi:AbrB family looped-hinge helix DNA binding protein
VIPKAIREELELKPGQVVQVIAHGDRIEMVPVRSMRELRGFLSGIDTVVERESDRT